MNTRHRKYCGPKHACDCVLRTGLEGGVGRENSIKVVRINSYLPRCKFFSKKYNDFAIIQIDLVNIFIDIPVPENEMLL